MNVEKISGLEIIAVYIVSILMVCAGIGLLQCANQADLMPNLFIISGILFCFFGLLFTSFATMWSILKYPMFFGTYLVFLNI